MTNLECIAAMKQDCVGSIYSCGLCGSTDDYGEDVTCTVPLIEGLWEDCVCEAGEYYCEGCRGTLEHFIELCRCDDNGRVLKSKYEVAWVIVREVRENRNRDHYWSALWARLRHSVYVEQDIIDWTHDVLCGKNHGGKDGI